MHHFQQAGPASHLAVALYPRVVLKAGLLRRIEMEEAQEQRAAAVGYLHQQTAPSAPAYIDALYLSDNHRVGARPQAANRVDPGAVLIAHRQMEQQIHRRLYAEALEFLHHPGADAGQGLQRMTGICDGRGRVDG